MIKKELRQNILQKLKEQDKDVKKKMDVELTERLCQLPAYEASQTIATYLSMGFEVDTSLFIQKALMDGKRLVVPKVMGKDYMVFVEYDSSCLEKSSFGVLEPISTCVVEPSDIDFMHVPGVAFNQNGYRIGFGGGFYDRYLVNFEGWTVSTAYPVQNCNFTPDIYDIPVREVIVYDEKN